MKTEDFYQTIENYLEENTRNLRLASFGISNSNIINFEVEYNNCYVSASLLPETYFSTCDLEKHLSYLIPSMVKKLALEYFLKGSK